MRNVEGSQFQLRHPDRPGKVTVAVHRNQVIEPWVVNKVLARATMTVVELRDLL